MKKDFKRLVLDTVKVEEYADVLGQENAIHAGEERQRDLSYLASRIVHLDFDLRTMLVDCAILGRQYWKKHHLPLINSLHRSLDIMHQLLIDLNRIQPAAKNASVDPSTLRNLLNDWIRFKKSVADMEIALQLPPMRRKMTWGQRTAPSMLTF
jgi:hypothetical protein